MILFEKKWGFVGSGGVPEVSPRDAGLKQRVFLRAEMNVENGQKTDWSASRDSVWKVLFQTARDFLKRLRANMSEITARGQHLDLGLRRGMASNHRDSSEAVWMNGKLGLHDVGSMEGPGGPTGPAT